MVHLIGSILGFFVALFAFNMLIAIVQVVVGLFTGYDPDKRLRDQEDMLRRQDRDRDYD